MPPSDNQSTPSGPSEPFELWRQIYETNERAWNAVLERTVNNSAFAESSGKILETFLSAQKTVRDNMRQYLEQINLPTREDIARLGELIVALEEKVDQVDDRLANIEGLLAARTSATASSESLSPSSGSASSSAQPASVRARTSATPLKDRGAAGASSASGASRRGRRTSGGETRSTRASAE